MLNKTLNLAQDEHISCLRSPNPKVTFFLSFFIIPGDDFNLVQIVFILLGQEQ